MNDKELMKSYKWNYERHAYDEYDVPPKSKIYTDDMDEIVQCAQCGRELTYGDSYTSLEIHTSGGLGFCVCEDCADEELKRKIADKKINKPEN